MKFRDKVRHIVHETFSSPTRDSVIVEVGGRSIALREGGDYTGLDLEGVTIHDANLSGVNLVNANLSNANLSRVNLRNANLAGANLKGVVINGGDFSDASIDLEALREVKVVGDTVPGVTLPEGEVD